MDILAIVVVCAAILGLAFWLEGRISRMESEDRARRDHPAGKFCSDCGYRVEDWDTHARLAHRKRVASPDDVW